LPNSRPTWKRSSKTKRLSWAAAYQRRSNGLAQATRVAHSDGRALSGAAIPDRAGDLSHLPLTSATGMYLGCVHQHYCERGKGCSRERHQPRVVWSAPAHSVNAADDCSLVTLILVIVEYASRIPRRSGCARAPLGGLVAASCLRLKRTRVPVKSRAASLML